MTQIALLCMILFGIVRSNDDITLKCPEYGLLTLIHSWFFMIFSMKFFACRTVTWNYIDTAILRIDSNAMAANFCIFCKMWNPSEAVSPFLCMTSIGKMQMVILCLAWWVAVRLRCLWISTCSKTRTRCSDAIHAYVVQHLHFQMRWGDHSSQFTFDQDC